MPALRCERIPSRGRWCLALVCAILFSFLCGAAAPKKIEKAEASSDLTEQDLQAVRDLFDKMGKAFVAGDAAACTALFVPDLRERVGDNVKSEFKQSRYLYFQVLQILPDDTLRENVHSVDVRFSTIVVPSDWAPELQQPLADYIRSALEEGRAKSGAAFNLNTDEILKGFIKAHKLQERIPRLSEPDANTTSQNFVIQKTQDGSFRLRDSSFFDNLGLRQGMGFVVEGLLALMAICALLAFWVWMGWEALRARPRYKVWRWVVLIPVLGALAFFLAAYLPRQIRGQGNAG